MSSLHRRVPLLCEWDADVAHTIVTHSMVNWCVTHCSGSAASWTKGAADLRSISLTSHTWSDCRGTRLRALECPEKSLWLGGRQCQNGRENWGWKGEERRQVQSKAGEQSQARTRWDKPSAAKAKELWEAIVLQPGRAEALFAPRNAESAMDKDCCPFPLSGRGAAGEACTDWLCQAARNEQCQCSHAVWTDLVTNTAQLLPEGIWDNNISIHSPIQTWLLCWPVSWSRTEGHAALLSVEGLVFPALDRSGKALRSLWCSPAPPAAVTIPTAAEQ